MEVLKINVYETVSVTEKVIMAKPVFVEKRVKNTPIVSPFFKLERRPFILSPDTTWAPTQARAPSLLIGGNLNKAASFG